ncbi:MAG: long-chain fatty acid--CoA ligase [Bacteroidales bacterium]|nr:long-chain fatty acid--CoA ligase [Bacteroidales bacterium]MBN2756300.1 long-chain fatty acid--CoA ligase [Bacteroidales bacterium]
MEETRIFDILEKYKTTFKGKADVLAIKKSEAWIKYSSEDYIRNVDFVSYALIRMGFIKGDKIATISNNRPEWNFIDMGMSQLGIVHVPIYPTISDEEFVHVLSHSESKMVIVSDIELYNKIKPIADKIEKIEAVYTFDIIENAKNFNQILKLGKETESETLKKELKKRKLEIDKNDLATIIYTSGTTGMPKGVMLSHWNFMFQVEKLYVILEERVKENSRSISFLPLCHVLERIGGYTYQYAGISIYYAESIERIAENIKEVKPQIFVTVPRLLEKIYDKIIATGKDLEGFKKDLFFWSVDLGLKYKETNNSLWYLAKLKIANILVFSKWRKALGGNVKMIISGGAALQERLARIFWSAGISVHEGYGLSETAPVICVNRINYPELMFGTVGPLLSDEQQVKIAEDGEILFKGPNLMLGYFKDEKLTNETIDEEGWFHTGDIGVFVKDKCLKITDRKKEMFKLSTGKYIAPQVVENIFKESIFIEQLMVVGANEKFCGALISPNFEFLHDWCHKKKIHYRDNLDLIENPIIIERYQKEIDKLNTRLGKTEMIKKFQLVCEEWTTDNGELSPTLKLRRKFVKEKYQRRFNQIYSINQKEFED